MKAKRIGFVVALLSCLVFLGVARWWREPRPAKGPTPPTRALQPSTRATRLEPIRLSGGRVVRADPGAPFELRGRVVSTATAGAVAGALITFGGADATEEVRSAASGEFVWSTSVLGAHQVVSITAPGFLPFAPLFGHSPVVFDARAGVHLDGVTLFVTPATAYLGVVLDSAERRVAGAGVRRLEPLDGEPDTFATDDRGEFHFHATDDSWFEASHAQFRPTLSRLDLAAQVSHRLVFRLGSRDGAAEREAGAISGLVVNDRGDGLENAIVRASGEGSEERTVSDEGGRFTLAGLRAARYKVVAEHPGWLSAEAHEVTPGSRNLTLRLTPGGRIAGTVREASTQKPIVAFTVVARVKKGAIERGENQSSSFFDAEGRYVLNGLRAATQCVSVVAFGLAASAEQCVDVAEKGEAHADFSLTRGARLTGRVIDGPSHAPLRGARVSLESSLGVSATLPLPVISSADTDDAGRFALSGLGSGVRSIFVAAEGHHSRVLPGITLDPDHDPPPVEVDLTPTGPGEEPRIESAGINAVVSAEGDHLLLGRLSPGGGAAQSDLREGDAILRVDGADVGPLGMQGAIERLRGAEGSVVIVTVSRPPDGTVLDIPVTRRRVINR